MGAARSEITDGLYLPTEFEGVIRNLNVSENYAKQWLGSCTADEITKVMALNY